MMGLFRRAQKALHFCKVRLQDRLACEGCCVGWSTRLLVPGTSWLRYAVFVLGAGGRVRPPSPSRVHVCWLTLCNSPSFALALGCPCKPCSSKTLRSAVWLLCTHSIGVPVPGACIAARASWTLIKLRILIAGTRCVCPSLVSCEH
eukprot:1136995-Pelagomonas_calceolata.AAC.1